MEYEMENAESFIHSKEERYALHKLVEDIISYFMPEIITFHLEIFKHFIGVYQ